MLECDKSKIIAGAISAPITSTKDKPSTLTAEEREFFEKTVVSVKCSVPVDVPIEAMDHSVLPKKYKEAFGNCWAREYKDGRRIPYLITIDEFFIHECFVALEKPYLKLESETLEDVIAHEIAHLRYWRHGKKHTAWTKYILGLIENGGSSPE